jgi:uncharacterized membrane protein YhhN
MQRNFFYIGLFCALSAIYLLATGFELDSLRWLTKPLLMPSLLLVFWLAVPASRVKHLVAGALLLSTAGDVLLMYTGAGWFIAGLSAFLCAHLLYIAAFTRISGFKNGFLVKKPWVLGFLAVYLIAFLSWILPYVPGGMRFPVATYALVISAMLASVINLKTALPSEKWKRMLLGGLLFMLSDSLIAISLFAFTFPGAALAIISTYILGQALLVYGVVVAAG